MFISNTTLTTPHDTAGFSLVEVLVALLILAIGLLGLAALQTQGVRFNNDAFVRTQGTTVAYDIIDKMRVNRDNATSYTTAFFPARNALPGTGYYSWGSPPYNCNALLATVANDLACWLNTVELLLPQGVATITQQGAPNADMYDISISWMDRQFKTDATCNAQTNHTWSVNLCLVNQTWTIWP